VLAVGQAVDVDAHRFVRVLRARVGATFTVCDASGVVWEAVVSAIEPFVLEVVGLAAAPDRNPSVALEVWVPLLKGGRTDDLVRQLTELGVTRIAPYASRHAVVKLEAGKVADKHERMRAIVREAGNQCGRTLLPEVLAPIIGIPTISPAGPAAFLWEGGGAPAREVLGQPPAHILIGPEGGLAPEEAEALVKRGWRATTLGARILRAETAVVAFAVMALSALGEL